jgi:hypothetical protein
MEARLLIMGAVLCALGAAGLIGYSFFEIAKIELVGLGGLVCLLVGVALLIVHSITGRAH